MTPSTLSDPRSIVFIDRTVPDSEWLATQADPGAKVFFLDIDTDGIEQIAEALKSYTGVESVQIISHGSEGLLKLGATELTQGNLAAYGNLIQQWGASLTDTADILLLGCNVAAGAKGQAFVKNLSELTGADVAASTNLTGNAALGGDWNLEYDAGLVEAPLAFQIQALAAYNSVLDNYTAGNETDLRNAISYANGHGGKDTITLTSDIYLYSRVEIEAGSNNGIDFIGNGYTIFGRGANQIFKIKTGEISFSNLTLRDGKAKGGNVTYGGGGGLGAGGGIFIDEGATVVLDGVNFTNNKAEGGTSEQGGGHGGKDSESGYDSSDGGQFNGEYGTPGAGGKGGDVVKDYKNADGNSKPAQEKQHGGNSSSFGTGGGGGGGGGGDDEGAPDGGRNGGNGGTGGFGAGGGGGGGGGVDDGEDADGEHGFGGAGGAGGTYAGKGGDGNRPNSDASVNGGRGGGGAGLGGAVFVDSGATLVVARSTFSGNQASGGQGANNGQGLGNDIFIRSDGTVIRDNPNLQYYFDSSAGSSFAFSLPTLRVSKRADTREGSTSVGGFTFNLTEAAKVDTIIKYSLAGTATRNTDYTGLDSVTIYKGQTSVDLNITPVDNQVYENLETVVLNLNNGVYVVDGNNSTATVNIADNEPIVSVVAVTNPAEPSTTGKFRIDLSEPSPGFKVYYTIGGTAIGGTISNNVANPSDADYSNSNLTRTYSTGTDLTRTATFTTGSPQSLTIEIPAINDDVYDPNETIVLTLKEDQNTTTKQDKPSADRSYRINTNSNTATLTIGEDDLVPVATIEKVSDLREGDTTNLGKFKIKLSSLALTGGANVRYQISGTATTGVDYDAKSSNTSISQSGTITFNKGETEKLINIDPVDDRIVDINESVIISLLSPLDPNSKEYSLGTATTATAIILDNDFVPVASITAGTTAPKEQAATPGIFTISLDSPALEGGAVIGYTVSGSATAGSDYSSLTGTVTIPKGQTSKTIDVTPINDTAFDPNETITVTLSPTTSTTSTAPRNHLIKDYGALIYFLGRQSGADQQLYDGDTLTLTNDFSVSGNYAIERNVHIVGNGKIISGQGVRAFNVAPNAKVTFSNLTIQNGSATAGGGLYVDKGAVVSLDGVNFRNNTAPDGNAVYVNQATLVVANSIFIANGGLFNGILGNNGKDIFVKSGSSIIQGTTPTGNEPTYSFEGGGGFIDLPTMTVSKQDTREGATAGKFTFTLSRALPVDTPINYTLSGSAVAGDYKLSSSTAIIKANTTSVDVTVTPTDDTIQEGMEQLILTLNNGVYAIDNNNKAATLNIADNEPFQIGDYGALSSLLARQGTAGGFNDGDKIVLTNNFDITGSYRITEDIEIIGNGHTISGNGQNQVFNVDKNAKVKFANLTIQNGYVKGGDVAKGGGGGLGAGGGIFIDTGATVVLDGVNFVHNQAQGGSSLATGGSGGGYNQAGFNSDSGGLLNGIYGPAGSGGQGGDVVPIVADRQQPAQSKQSGGSGSFGTGGGGGGGGGGDMTSHSADDYDGGRNGGPGGAGGFGAGGGGGGGGGVDDLDTISLPFGGVVGDFEEHGQGGAGGAGGAYGGAGGNGNTPAQDTETAVAGGQGGGGAGLGGAVFVNQATLIVANTTFNDNNAFGGSGANPGQVEGRDIFVRSGSSIIRGSTLIGPEPRYFYDGGGGAGSLPTLTVSKQDTREGGTPGKFTFTLSRALPVDTPINYTLSGNAAASDYTLSGTAIIKANTTSVDVTVTPTDDTIREGIEQLTLTLNNGVYAIDNNNKTATLNIADNVPPFQIGDYGALASLLARQGTADGFNDGDKILLTNDFEINGSYRITEDIEIIGNGKTISGKGNSQVFNVAPNAKVTFSNLTIQNGSATNGGGLYVDQGAVVRLDGVSFRNNTAQNGNAVYVNQGTLVVTNSTFAGNSGFGGGILGNNGKDIFVESGSTILQGTTTGNLPTYNFEGNGAPLGLPTLSVSKTADTQEGGTIAGQFTFTLTSALPIDVPINYTLSGSATPGDYQLSSGTVVIRANTTSVNVTVTAEDDTIVEGMERLNLTLNNGIYVIDSTKKTAMMNIADNESTAINSYDINPTQKTASLTIVDDEVLPIARVVKVNNVTEGGIGQFNIVLDIPALDGGAIVKYQIGGTATSPNDYLLPVTQETTIRQGEKSVTVSIPTVDDRIAEDLESVTLTLLAGTGTDYTIAGSTQVTDTVDITDNDSAGADISKQVITTNEAGGKDKFTVQLTSQPTSDVTVNLTGLIATEGSLNTSNLVFTSTNWGTAQEVEVTGVDDTANDGNQSSQLELRATSQDAKYNNRSLGTVNVTNSDDDGFDVIVSSIANIREGGSSATYNLSLTKPPTGTVQMAIAADSQLQVSLDGQTYASQLALTATSTAAQKIYVRAIDNTQVDGDRLGKITHTISSATDPNYANKTIPSLAVNIADNDVPTLSIVSTYNASEKSEVTGAFNLALSDPAPKGGITVNYTIDNNIDKPATSGTDYEPLSGTVLIPAGETGISIPVVPKQDPIDETGDNIESIKLDLASGSGYTVGSAAQGTVKITDDDISGVRIVETGNQTTTNEGGAFDSYLVSLTSQPSQNVVVNINSGAGLTTNIQQLTFTRDNWQPQQQVNITAVNDDLVTGDRTVNINHTLASSDANYASIVPSPVAVKVKEDDLAGVIFTATGNGNAISENASGNISDEYKVRLTSKPTSNVIVTPTIGNSRLQSIAPITFTPNDWNQEQTLTIAFKADDKIAQGTQTTTIEHISTSADLNYQINNAGSIVVTLNDNDVAGVAIVQSGGKTNIEEAGFADTFTVALTSQPTATVKIDLGTSVDWETDLTSLEFTPQNWNTPQVVIVEATQDKQTELKETTSLTLTASSITDPGYNNIAIAPITVEVVDEIDRQVSNDEINAISNYVESALNDLDTQIQDQLKQLQVPLVGESLYAKGKDILAFKADLIAAILQAKDVKFSDLAKVIADGFTTAFNKSGVIVDVKHEISTGNGQAFKLLISVTYPIKDIDLAVDLSKDASLDGTGKLGVELKGKAKLKATALLSLGLGRATSSFGEDLQTAKEYTKDQTSFNSVQKLEPGVIGSLLKSAKALFGKTGYEPPDSALFIDTQNTFLQADFGIELSDDFKAAGFLGPLTAIFQNDTSNNNTKTKAGITLNVGLKDADIGVGYKFLDVDRDGQLDANEIQTGVFFLGDASTKPLIYWRDLDKEKDGKYDAKDGNEVVLLQTNEFRSFQGNPNIQVKPLLYNEPSNFPRTSVQWFDVNDSKIFESNLDLLGSRLPDGSFDLPYTPSNNGPFDPYDSNQNGYFDRDDQYQGKGTLYTFVPDNALQFDRHDPLSNPNNPNDANGFQFLDANQDGIWNYVNAQKTEREPWVKSFGQTFPVTGWSKDITLPEFKDKPIYTLWAIKAKPAILFRDTNGDNRFDPTSEPFLNSRTDGTFAIHPLFDSNGDKLYSNGDNNASGKLYVLRDDGNRLTAIEKSNLAAINQTGTVSFIKQQLTASAEVSANLGLQASIGAIGIGANLPNLAAEIAVKYTPLKYVYNQPAAASKPKFTAALNNARFDLGSWLGNQIQPFAAQVNKYVKPFVPILNALNTEVKLISSLGLTSAFDINHDNKVTVLELAGSIGKIINPENTAKIDKSIAQVDKWLFYIGKIASYVEILSEFKGVNDSGLVINFGSFNYPKLTTDSVNLTEEQVLDRLNEIKQSSTATATQISRIEKAKVLLNDKVISFPILSNFLGLIDGRDVPLVALQLPPIDIGFNARKTFPVWGPVSGLLEGSFNAQFNLAFGFDTSGINKFATKVKRVAETLLQPFDQVTLSPLDQLLPLDGIYISDRANADGTGADKPEVSVTAQIAAGAGIDVGVASGYLLGGIKGIANLDLIDVGESSGTSDGRIHLSEIVDQSFNVFRLYGGVNAFLGAQVNVTGLGKVYENNLATLPLFTFDVGPAGTKSGSAFDGYLAGSQVFFDANFDGVWDWTEPFTYTNADGSYQLDIPLRQYDINQNNRIDPTEGQIVITGGIDTSTSLPLAVPIKTTVDATVATPFTTLVTELSKLDLIAAETQLQTGIGLSNLSVDLLNFDALSALSATTAEQQELGVKVLAARIQIQDFLTRATQLILDNQGNSNLDSVSIANVLLDAIASDIATDGTLALTTATDVKNLLNYAIGKLQPTAAELNLTLEKIGTLADLVAANSTTINTAVADTTKILTDRVTAITNVIVPLLDTTAATYLETTVFVDLFDRITTKLAKAVRTGDEASSLVKKSLGLSATLDLKTYNALDAVKTGTDPDAVNIFAQQVQLQSLFVQASALVQGNDSTKTPTAASNQISQSIADYLVKQPPASNALQDLSKESTINAIVSGAVPLLSTADVAKIAEVIAASNAKIQTIVADPGLTVTEQLNQIAQSQYVAQNLIAEDLKKVGAGEQNAADNLVDAYVGTHLDQKIADAAAQINNPAQRSNVNNDAPLAVDDLVTAQGPITIDVLANDSDPNGDRLQVTLLTAPNGISGSVLLNPDGKTILYTPKSGFLGKESFNYIVGDGKGGLKNANVQVAVTTTRNDFRGDGKSDILWRNDYGSVALWQMDGATVTTAGLTSISDVDASWTTAGTGDFNGDGKSDVLWRNTNGAVAVWTMNGAIVTSSSSTSIPALDNSWTVAGLGDYNGDSKSDILWRNTNGAVAIWAMNGPTVSSSSLTSTPTVDSSWQVAGNGDFNGDGQSDILWRNDDGTVALWQMNGSAVTAATAVFKVAADWKITGNGDFNGDGKSDILWRNDDGSVALWQMNGANITSSKLTSTPVLDQSWSLAEIGDYNRDGQSDILWRNTSGAAAVWTMNGATVLASTLTSTPADSSSWKIATPIF